MYKKNKNRLDEEIDIPNIGLTMSRDIMPQISIEGFLKFLNGKGISYKKQKVECTKLKSSQYDFDDDKIMSMISGDGKQKPILVSTDNHVLDGHHRWLADHNKGEKTSLAWVIDAPILQLIHLAKEYNNLTEEVTRKSFMPMVDSFVSFASKKLGILEPPKLGYQDNFSDDTTQPSFGCYNPESKEITIRTKNRHPMDVLRTLAHELVHHKQNEDGRIKDAKKEGATGSPIEDEANSMAGRILRWYGKANPDLFKMKYMVENATFVVGGPCSGKDIFVRKLKKQYHMKEMDITKISKNNMTSNMLISCSAEHLAPVTKMNNFLKSHGYETKMVFVEVTDETSKKRNEERSKKGQRILEESIRSVKYTTCSKNKEVFQKMFGNDMVVIDNSQKEKINESKLDTKFSLFLEGSKTDIQRTPRGIGEKRSGKTTKKRLIKKLKETPPANYGLGDEWDENKVGTVFGYTEEVEKWAKDPKTIERYSKKYGSNGPLKLQETAKNLSQMKPSDKVNIKPLSIKQLRESFVKKGTGKRIVKKHK